MRIVTGSSKRIGEAIARVLAHEGATVIVHGRNREKAERVASTILALGEQAHVVIGDLTQDDAVEWLVMEAEAVAGGIDILVNNAGGSGGVKESWDNTQSSSWPSAYDRNVLAAVRITTRVLPGMRQAKWGRVINISSLAAIMPPPTAPDYSACKAAMNAMTASLAKAVAADGITINSVSPGTIRSSILEDRFREIMKERGLGDADAPWWDIEQAVLPIFAQVPVGRVGEPDEIANAIAFLASPSAGYITGINPRVDGGLSPSL